jgi:hypothetical protein
VLADGTSLPIPCGDFGTSLAERSHEVRSVGEGSTSEKPDHLHRWLLRARREGPGSCRAAAKQDDKIAPSYT